MIEAVNSVISNAAYTKVAAEQQSVANSYAANPQRIQQAPQAPYLSLYVKVDVNFDKAVLQIRDTDTGDVVRQIPTESQLEAYRRAQTSNAVRPSEYKETADVIIVSSEAADGGEPTTPPPTQAAQVNPPTEIQTAAVSAPVPKAPVSASVDTQA